MNVRVQAREIVPGDLMLPRGERVVYVGRAGQDGRLSVHLDTGRIISFRADTTLAVFRQGVAES